MGNGGSKANKAGNQLENFVQQKLLSLGYQEILNDKRLIFQNRHALSGKQFARHVHVGESIYGARRYVDFIVFNPDLFSDALIVECKWQEKPGSVDEKYPYLHCNILKTGVPSIVLIDGGGYKIKAMEWLKSQVNPDTALKGVYTMVELQKKINAGFF